MVTEGNSRRKIKGKLSIVDQHIKTENAKSKSNADEQV